MNFLKRFILVLIFTIGVLTKGVIVATLAPSQVTKKFVYELAKGNNSRAEQCVDPAILNKEFDTGYGFGIPIMPRWESIMQGIKNKKQWVTKVDLLRGPIIISETRNNNYSTVKFELILKENRGGKIEKVQRICSFNLQNINGRWLIIGWKEISQKTLAVLATAKPLLDPEKNGQVIAQQEKTLQIVAQAGVKRIPLMVGWTKAKVTNFFGPPGGSSGDRWGYSFTSYGVEVNMYIYFKNDKVYNVFVHSVVGRHFIDNRLLPQELFTRKFKFDEGFPNEFQYNFGDRICVMTTDPEYDFSSAEEAKEFLLKRKVKVVKYEEIDKKFLPPDW